jgi:glycosyltransferase involved in cell wall biosynthesis
MVSPHPVYQPRGTPISVFNRCVALCALGHEIDLVTYPIGEDRPVEGLRYRRAPLPGVTDVRVGPSKAKIPLNAAVALHAARQLLTHRGHYDVVHTHEEAGLIGWAVKRLSGLPHVYDMGNDWAVVLSNYGLPAAHPLTRVAGALEHRVVGGADRVIVHFASLAPDPAADAGLARKPRRPSTPTFVVPNLPLTPPPTAAEVKAWRQRWANDDRPVVLYVGTLEPYQGIDLLVDAIAQLAGEARLVIAGGRPEQVTALSAEVQQRGLAKDITVAGPIPPASVAAALGAADALVSPRRSGTNTPLKLWEYLRAGRPLVVTDIPAHTDVLGPDDARIVAPTAEGLATGIYDALTAGRTPRRKAGTSPAAYLQAVAQAYAGLGAPPRFGPLEARRRLSRMAMPLAPEGAGSGADRAPEGGPEDRRVERRG